MEEGERVSAVVAEEEDGEFWGIRVLGEEFEKWGNSDWGFGAMWSEQCGDERGCGCGHCGAGTATVRRATWEIGSC